MERRRGLQHRVPQGEIEHVVLTILVLELDPLLEHAANPRRTLHVVLDLFGDGHRSPHIHSLCVAPCAGQDVSSRMSRSRSSPNPKIKKAGRSMALQTLTGEPRTENLTAHD